MIKSIKASKIKDSRGKPTIKVELSTNSGKFFSSVPSGTSTGKFEAEAKSAGEAVRNINKIINPAIYGEKEDSQKEIDDLLIKLDGSQNKSFLGANAILAVSIAVSRAAAGKRRIPLWKRISEISGKKPKMPSPSILQIEGALHGGKNGADVQEFMTVFPEKKFKDNFSQGKEIYSFLRKILLRRYGKKAIKLGMEGAFLPPIKKTEEILDVVIEAASMAKLERKIKFILDVAATHDQINFSRNYYLELIKKYPIAGLEDPFPENSWSKWKNLLIEIKKKNVLVIGDDLTVTNSARIKKAFEKKSCNAVIIKPNQIGTVSETIAAANLARSFGWKIMVSHRSGETMDSFIADLSVGLGADFIKTGSPSKPERMIKYKRLLEIEKELNGIF
jgi:enolase